MAYESLKAEIRQYIKTNGQNEITGQILQNVLLDMVNEYPLMDDYATRLWVESQGYITSAALSGYATQSWVSGNFLQLDGGGTVYDGDYYLGIFGNELLFKYNGTTYGSISLDYGPDGPEFDISSNATLGGATIATQTWVGQNYMPNSTAVINGVTGDDLGRLTMTGNNFTTTVLDLTHQHRWEELTDVPTTLRDMGIDEEYLPISAGSGNPLTGDLYFDANSACFELTVNPYSFSTVLSYLGLTCQKTGSGMADESYHVTIDDHSIELYSSVTAFDETATHTTLITPSGITVDGNAVATQYWVQSQGYITSAALSGYATQSWVSSNFLQLDGGGTVYDGDYYLGIFGNELLFKYNGTTYGSISLDYGPDGPEFDISSNATLGGATIATQTWVDANYATQSTVNGLSYINGVALNNDGSISLTGHSFTTTILDLTHQHRWEELTDVPTTLRDLGIKEEYLLLSGGNMTGQIYFGAELGVVFDVDSYICTGSDNYLHINGYDAIVMSISGTDKLEISSNGVGIGISNPSYSLEVNGQAMIYREVGIGTSPVEGYSLDIDGIARANSFVNNSDIRKKDILEYDVAPGFEEVVNAPTIRYEWKNPGRNNHGVHVGSIAQYWRNAMPEAVIEDVDGYLSMQYDVIALLSAVSVAKKVADNEYRIAALEQENALLRMEVNTLKELV